MKETDIEKIIQEKGNGEEKSEECRARGLELSDAAHLRLVRVLLVALPVPESENSLGSFF